MIGISSDIIVFGFPSKYLFVSLCIQYVSVAAKKSDIVAAIFSACIHISASLRFLLRYSSIDVIFIKPMIESTVSITKRCCTHQPVERILDRVMAKTVKFSDVCSFCFAIISVISGKYY